MVLPVLACPHCGAALTRLDGVVGCGSGHRFDLARQGHLTLLARGARTDTADTAEMVAARHAFLSAGHFRPIAAAAARAAVRATAGTRATGAPATFVEVGAGTGYYLSLVLEAVPGVGVAVDSSVRAARYAARAHPLVGAVVADAWAPLPLRSGVADLVLSVFAPRNSAEFSRILRPGGRLVVVTPLPDHLTELVAALGLLSVGEEKEERLAESLAGKFQHLDSTRVRFELALARTAVAQLALMGPSAHHLDRAAFARSVKQLSEPVRVTVAVTVSVWQPISESGAPSGLRPG